MSKRLQDLLSSALFVCAILAGTVVAKYALYSGGSDPFERQRLEMVQNQIATSGYWGRDPVIDKKVLEAMRTVPRHKFVPTAIRSRAYNDSPLPIGHGQTISQPYIVAYMTEMLECDKDAVTLEIGTGSGYQAAVLSRIAKKVYTIEIVKALGEEAAERLKELKYKNVECRVGDGYYGWEEHGPFDAIVVTAATSHIPPPLLEQLKPGGRMAIPVGPPMHVQQLMLIVKQKDGSIIKRSVMAVRFVPFIGKAEGGKGPGQSAPTE